MSACVISLAERCGVCSRRIPKEPPYDFVIFGSIKHEFTLRVCKGCSRARKNEAFACLQRLAILSAARHA